MERIGFRDGAHGLLREDPRELADAAVTLLRDPERWHHAGIAAREQVRDFGWSALARPLEARYREAVAVHERVEAR